MILDLFADFSGPWINHSRSVFIGFGLSGPGDTDQDTSKVLFGSATDRGVGSRPRTCNWL